MQQPVREVYSLLMPVNDGRVILPRAAVAEVTGYVRPKDRPENAPEFVLGFIDWQGQRIPLVSFEAARGQPVPELGRRTRIAVVFGTAGRLDPNVFAVITQGYPYLVRVNENVLQREEMDDGDEALVLARVRMANEKPRIPDFEQLEVMIADGLGEQGGKVDVAAAEPVDELDAIESGEEELDAGLRIEEPGEDPEVEPEVSQGGDDEAAVEASDLNLNEVTAFGAETDYSAELGELAGALDSDEPKDDDGESSDDFGLDLSDLEIEGNDTNADEAAADDDAGEIDFSDIEIDLDEDDEKKPD